MKDKTLYYLFYLLVAVLLLVLCLYHDTPYLVVFCLSVCLSSFSIGFSTKVPNPSKKRSAESQIWKVNCWTSSK